MRDSAEVSFDFVSDADFTVLERLGLDHESGPTGVIARSALVVLSSQGTVLWRHIGENYRVRPTPEEILAAVEPVVESPAVVEVDTAAE